MPDDMQLSIPPGNGRAVMRDARSGLWLCFTDPVRVVTAMFPDEVIPALREVEKATGEGFYAAGYVAYEAAPAFDPTLATLPDPDFPPLWFALYPPPKAFAALPEPAAIPPLEWTSNLPECLYFEKINRIREYIRQGDTYQANFTYRLTAPDCPDPWALFLAMAAAQEAPHGAYLDTGDWVVCSASPELFFERDGAQITSKPMKGTAPRGRWFAEDRARAEALRCSEKDRAENVMIVDMVRNDLGRVAETGSVAVPSLFDVERYPTVWQMVSTVTARTGASLGDVFRALFPPASITGAPKRRTMEILAELETSPRRVYTGAVGYVAPGGRCQFNVAIRTALINRASGMAEYGVGGGIVWDSSPGGEWEESRVKARVLAKPRPQFDLLESLLWTPDDGYWLLDRHLERLRDSAVYFGYAVDIECVRESLLRHAAQGLTCPSKVRLLCSRAGLARVESGPLGVAPDSRTPVPLATVPVDPENVFLHHKTTCREAYEEALRSRPGAADVLLVNTCGELTESTRANLVFERDGRLLTPPLDCGLLAGTLRAEMIARGELSEAVLPLDALPGCSRLFLANSVRGMWEIPFPKAPLV
jgi:para-aminobenzoate synthetase / 4-amino-4-deoxychorismate lyase